HRSLNHALSTVPTPVLIVSALVVCGSATAFGQTSPGPVPAGPLFGSAGGRSGPAPQSLHLTVAVSGAYDESLSSEDAAAADGSIADGQSSNLTAGLSFTRSRSRVGISAGLTSSLRRYPGVDRLVDTSETATAGVTGRLNRTTGLRLGVEASRILPFALDGLAIEPGPADGRASSTGLESTVLDGTRTTVGGLAEVTRTLGRWSTLTFGYGARQSETRFVGERIADQRAGGQFARRLGRDASFRIDYAARYSTRRVVDREQPAWSHDLQLGVERQWRHAAGRTSLYAGGGPSLVDEGPVLVNGDAGRAPATRVAGTVTFDHQIRSFGARASYRRGGTV